MPTGFPPSGTRCPADGSPLAPAETAGARALDCQVCGGVMYGLSPFERLLPAGLGARVWVASADGPADQACPFCTRPMHAPDPAAPGLDPGLRVCRLCEQVWVPGTARPWLASRRGPDGDAAPGPLAAPAADACECPNCGAPLQPDGAGRCRYCRAQVAAPAPVTLSMQAPELPGAGARWAALAERLMRPVD
mgnify:CR=1 FL=1